jgi:hypothetical protein
MHEAEDKKRLLACEPAGGLPGDAPGNVVAAVGEVPLDSTSYVTNLIKQRYRHEQQ